MMNKYVKDRNPFGPVSDSNDQMPVGNVRVGGNAQMAKVTGDNEWGEYEGTVPKPKNIMITKMGM